MARKRKVIQGDKRLISLVGTQPIRSLHEDKVLIREAIGRRYEK